MSQAHLVASVVHKDSCDIYGEVNSYDLDTMIELIGCSFVALEASAKLADIPDEGLRDEIKAKIADIFTTYSEDVDQNTTDTFVSKFDTPPIGDAINFVIFGNTPEFMDEYAEAHFAEAPTVLLDSQIQIQGRPSGGLE